MIQKNLIFTSYRFIVIFCICTCIHNLYAWYPQSQTAVLGPLGLELRTVVSPVCCKLNFGPLQEQLVILTAGKTVSPAPIYALGSFDILFAF